MRARNPLTPNCDIEKLYAEIGLDYETGLPVAAQAQPTDIAGLQARQIELENDWMRAKPERAAEIAREMGDIQIALNRINGGPLELTEREKAYLK